MPVMPPPVPPVELGLVAELEPVPLGVPPTTMLLLVDGVEVPPLAFGAAFTISIVAWLELLLTGSQTWYIPAWTVTVSCADFPLPILGVLFAFKPVPMIARP